MKKIFLSLSILLTPVLTLADGFGGVNGDCMMFGGYGGGMMSNGWWFTLAGFGQIVWLIVGILAAIWLWGQINKKKK